MGTALMIVGCSGLLLVLGVIVRDIYCEKRQIARMRRLAGTWDRLRREGMAKVGDHISDDEDGPYFRMGDKGEYR